MPYRASSAWSPEEQALLLEGEETLRSYGQPLDLTRFDARHWMTSEEPLEEIARRLDASRHFALMTPAMIRALSPVDRRLFDAGLQGANPAGLYGYRPPTREGSG